MPEEAHRPDPERDRARIAELTAELDAAQRSIDALVERSAIELDDVDRFSIYKTITQLENMVDKRNRELGDLRSVRAALFDGNPDAILELDGDHRIVGCNLRAEQHLHRAAANLVGVPVSAILEPASGAALTGLLWAGFSGVGDSPITLEDGRKVSFAVGTPAGALRYVVLRDDTARHVLEEELHHARRFASIGHLAGGVAHQINNPLAVIQGRVELLQSMRELDPSSLGRQLQVIMEHCRRIAAIVENLQTYARPRPPERQHVPIEPVLRRTLHHFASRLHRLQVQLHIEPSDLYVDADPGQLTQILGNLLTTVADQGTKRRAFPLHVTAGPGVGGVVIVCDATELPAAVLEELESPYPPSGRILDPGASLALSISWALIRENGGQLDWLRDTKQLMLTLPGRTTPHAATRTTGGEGRSGSLSILVVDDEQLLCETVTWMLAEEGHRIVAVHAAEDALARLQQESFDLVLTDLRLPGMDGEALLRAMGDRWPELAARSILTSGLLHTPRSETTYLQKPFSRAQLLEVIRRMSPAQGVSTP